MNDLDKIKDLLGSEDPTNRELGIVLALSQGMSLDELVDKCYNEKWFYIKDNGYLKEEWYDYDLGNREFQSYSNYCDIFNISNRNIEYHNVSFIEGFTKLIISFIQDNYPELLNKINKK